MKVAEQLNQFARENQAARAVFESFASRQRSRSYLNLAILRRRLSQMGYKYATEDYAAVLKFLADIGLGQLEVTKKGKVRALKDITTTLQSIGEVALGQKEVDFTPWTGRPKTAKQSRLETKQSTPLVLTFMLRGKPVNVSIPKDLTRDDVAELVETLGSIGA